MAIGLHIIGAKSFLEFLRFSLYLTFVPLLVGATLSCSKEFKPTPAETAESVRIIEQAVRKEIGKSEGPITDGDRLEVAELHLSNTSVSDLHSLGELRNLQGLSLSGCKKVKDLSPLEGLPHLVYLDLSGCSNVSEIPNKLRRKSGLKLIEP